MDNMSGAYYYNTVGGSTHPVVQYMPYGSFGHLPIQPQNQPPQMMPAPHRMMTPSTMPPPVAQSFAPFQSNHVGILPQSSMAMPQTLSQQIPSSQFSNSSAWSNGLNSVSSYYYGGQTSEGRNPTYSTRQKPLSPDVPQFFPSSAAVIGPLSATSNSLPGVKCEISSLSGYGSHTGFNKDTSSLSESNLPEDDRIRESLFRKFGEIIANHGEAIEATNSKIVDLFIKLSANERKLIMMQGSIKAFLATCPYIDVKQNSLSLSGPLPAVQIDSMSSQNFIPCSDIPVVDDGGLPEIEADVDIKDNIIRRFGEILQDGPLEVTSQKVLNLFLNLSSAERRLVNSMGGIPEFLSQSNCISICDKLLTLTGQLPNSMPQLTSDLAPGLFGNESTYNSAMVASSTEAMFFSSASILNVTSPVFTPRSHDTGFQLSHPMMENNQSHTLAALETNRSHNASAESSIATDSAYSSADGTNISSPILQTMLSELSSPSNGACSLLTQSFHNAADPHYLSVTDNKDNSTTPHVGIEQNHSDVVRTMDNIAVQCVIECVDSSTQTDDKPLTTSGDVMMKKYELALHRAKQAEESVIGLQFSQGTQSLFQLKHDILEAYLKNMRTSGTSNQDKSSLQHEYTNIMRHIQDELDRIQIVHDSNVASVRDGLPLRALPAVTFSYPSIPQSLMPANAQQRYWPRIPSSGDGPAALESQLRDSQGRTISETSITSLDSVSERRPPGLDNLQAMKVIPTRETSSWDFKNKSMLEVEPMDASKRLREQDYCNFSSVDVSQQLMMMLKIGGSAPSQEVFPMTGVFPYLNTSNNRKTQPVSSYMAPPPASVSETGSQLKNHRVEPISSILSQNSDAQVLAHQGSFSESSQHNGGTECGEFSNNCESIRTRTRTRKSKRENKEDTTMTANPPQNAELKYIPRTSVEFGGNVKQTNAWSLPKSKEPSPWEETNPAQVWSNFQTQRTSQSDVPKSTMSNFSQSNPWKTNQSTAMLNLIDDSEDMNGIEQVSEKSQSTIKVQKKMSEYAAAPPVEHRNKMWKPLPVSHSSIETVAANILQPGMPRGYNMAPEPPKVATPDVDEYSTLPPSITEVNDRSQKNKLSAVNTIKKGVSTRTDSPSTVSGISEINMIDDFMLWETLPTVQESEWQQVAKKPKKTADNPEPSALTSNFEKLVSRIQTSYSTLSRQDILKVIQQVRTKHGGLKGLSMSKILEDVAEFIGEPPIESKFDEEPHEGNLLYKTSICAFWQQGKCTRATKACVYAHGKKDLRPSPKMHMCQNIATKGTCSHGDKCVFAHSKEEMLKAGPSKK